MAAAGFRRSGSQNVSIPPATIFRLYANRWYSDFARPATCLYDEKYLRVGFDQDRQAFLTTTFLTTVFNKRC